MATAAAVRTRERSWLALESAGNVPSSVTPAEGTLDVTVVLLEGGYASTAIGPIEVFHSAGTLWNWLHGEVQSPRFRVRTASLDGKGVTGLYPLGLMPQCSIKDIRHTDIIIVSASGPDVQQHIARNTPLLPWLRKWHAKGAYVAGICSAAALLAEAGLLDGKVATTHWAVADVLRERYPRVRWQPEQFVTEDRRMMCSGGVYAAIDLSLYLVEKFCGHEVALQCARSLLVSMPRGRQSGYALLPLSRPHDDERIREVEDWLRQNFDRDVSIERLADRAAWRAELHSSLQGSHWSPARSLCPDTADFRGARTPGTRHAVYPNGMLENRLRGHRLLPQPVQAPHRNDARRLPHPVCHHELRPRRADDCESQR